MRSTASIVCLPFLIGLEWPRYSDEDDRRINFTAENNIVSEFRRAQCEFFWSLYDEEF